ncbi:hypothetical protein HDU91_002741 [Kappamyces sp. JEL0680]|nr:hypothetical protein HDU91_002741 [Kappamyces sp. JEL0680]
MQPETRGLKTEPPAVYQFQFTWSGSKLHTSLASHCTILDLKAAIYDLTQVLPARQKLIGLVKGRLPSDETVLSNLANPSAPHFRFLMMGTKEEHIIKEPSDMDFDVVNDLDIEYSRGEFAPWKQVENLATLQKVIQETHINVINDLSPRKKLIVFDLDYTLFDCKSQVSHISILARPGMHEMLSVLSTHYEFCIWSQTSWRWLEAKITELGTPAAQ